MLYECLLLSWVQPIFADLIETILQLHKCLMIVTFFAKRTHQNTVKESKDIWIRGVSDPFKIVFFVFSDSFNNFGKFPGSIAKVVGIVVGDVRGAQNFLLHYIKLIINNFLFHRKEFRSDRFGINFYIIWNKRDFEFSIKITTSQLLYLKWRTDRFQLLSEHLSDLFQLLCLFSHVTLLSF